LHEAESCFRCALRISPENADVYFNLGNVLNSMGLSGAAEESYKNTLKIDPGNVGAMVNLALILENKGDYEQAQYLCEHALKTNTGHIEAWINLCSLFHMQGKHQEAECAIRAALKIHPNSNLARSGLLFNLNYYATDAGVIFREHKDYEKYCAPRLPTSNMFTNSKEPGRRLRVGYVSPDFRTHSVAYFFEPLLERHNEKVVETYCYSFVSHPDDTTHRLRGLSDNWRDVSNMSPAEISNVIRQDKIDILVDLAGHTGKNLMLVFVLRSAPIQVTYLGYPNTSGISTIDYRFTDACADPPGMTERFHTERLVRLPRSFLCYKPSVEASISVGPLPEMNNGAITFGSFNNLAKMTPDTIKLWGKILRALPDSRLILKSQPFVNENLQKYFASLFLDQGVEGGRVEFVSWMPTMQSHLRLYDRVDIALDTFPYNGTTTTCEALWMGVPVISMAGRMHAGRVGSSILTQLGLERFIANDVEEYYSKAVRLAGSKRTRQDLRNNLRSTMKRSALCDYSQFAKNVEKEYGKMWRKWCLKEAPFVEHEPQKNIT